MSKEKKKDIIEWILTFAAALVLALLIRTFVFEFVVIKQSSMYPTLVAEQKVGVCKLSYLNDNPERGDIIIVKIDEKTNYVKRAIAFGGETVEIKDNTVYINGEALSEDYIADTLVYNDYGPVSVAQGCVFVMGDNRPSSIDSRREEVGQIPYERIIGKVVFRIKPYTFYGF